MSHLDVKVKMTKTTGFAWDDQNIAPLFSRWLFVRFGIHKRQAGTLPSETIHWGTRWWGQNRPWRPLSWLFRSSKWKNHFLHSSDTFLFTFLLCLEKRPESRKFSKTSLDLKLKPSDFIPEGRDGDYKRIPVPSHEAHIFSNKATAYAEWTRGRRGHSGQGGGKWEILQHGF